MTKQSFFDMDYNPKIDYLICKNLLMNWPREYNEFQLRKAFRKNYKRTDKDLSKIYKAKKYLKKHKLINFNVNEYCELITLLSGNAYHYNYKVDFNNMNTNTFPDYVIYLRYLNDTTTQYIACALMLLYISSKEKTLIIPYRGMIKKMLSEDYDKYNIDVLVDILKERTVKNNIRHDIRINKHIVPTLINHKDEFLEKFKDIKAFGIFGSFSMEKANEYSDLDMLIISENDSLILKDMIKEYWKKYFDLEIDVKVVKEDEIDSDLTECMKKTLRIIE